MSRKPVKKSVQRKPIILLADSQLLFDDSFNRRYLDVQCSSFGENKVKAAFIGVSGDDNPLFFRIFEAFISRRRAHSYRQISRRFSEQERAFLSEADLIVLGGGDPIAGWKILQQSGMAEVVIKRYYEGALLIGVSAGAIQLGIAVKEESTMFSLVPMLIDVHNEENEWSSLRNSLLKNTSYITGLGIPKGGGMLYHPDQTVEAVARPLHEFRKREHRVIEHLIMPEESKL